MIKSFMFFLLIISGILITFTSSVLFRRGVDSLVELLNIYDFWVFGLILLFMIIFFEKTTKFIGGKRLRKFAVRYAFGYMVLSGLVLIASKVATEAGQSVAQYDSFYYFACVGISIAVLFLRDIYRKMDKKIDQDCKLH